MITKKMAAGMQKIADENNARVSRANAISAMSVNARRGVKIAAGDVAWQVDALIERLQTLKERAVEGNLKSYDRPDTGAVDRAVDALNAALRERDAIAATIAAMGGAK